MKCRLMLHLGLHCLSMYTFMGIHLYTINIKLIDCHTLPDNANGRVTYSKILCPFVSVRMRFLSVRHAVNAFRVR